MKVFFTFFGILTSLMSCSQNIMIYKRDSAWMSNSKNKPVDLSAAPVDSTIVPVILPFSNFLVKDVRFFTGYIGGRIKKDPVFNDITYEKIGLAKETSAAVADYLNSNLNVSFITSDIKLGCFIKQLLITQLDSSYKEAHKPEVFNRMKFEMEGYLIKDNLFYPALRLDTIAFLATSVKNRYEILENVLRTFTTKAAAIDTGKVFKRSAYSHSDLEKRYNARFNKPILQAKQLNKGVYTNFIEFVNNNPSIKENTFKKDKVAGILYTKTTANDWMPEKKSFGFCDGKVLWINVEHTFYPLVRQQNTFAFRADYYNINNRGRSGTTVYISNDPVTSLGSTLLANAIDNAIENSTVRKVLFQLDMETGEYN